MYGKSDTMGLEWDRFSTSHDKSNALLQVIERNLMISIDLFKF
jgi:hypothetical protein